MKKKITYILLFIILIFQHVMAQQLIEKSKLTLQLKNGSEVICYKSYAMNGDNENSYYYLPTNLHFAVNQSGVKSHSLIVYRDENQEINGAIMHWLLSWGLTTTQRQELRDILKSTIGKDAKLIGAVLAEPVDSFDDFKIVGNNTLSKVLNTALVNKGKVPLMPNSKIAIAFKFSKDEATAINDLFSNYKEQKQTSIQMQFLVSYKKSNGKIGKKIITISQNLQTLITH